MKAKASSVREVAAETVVVVLQWLRLVQKVKRNREKAKEVVINGDFKAQIKLLAEQLADFSTFSGRITQ